MPKPNFVVPANWQLPDAFRQRLGNSAGRQRLMEYESHLLIVAHEVPAKGEASRRGLLFWRDPAGDWKCNAAGPGHIALAQLVQRYAQRIEEYDSLESSAVHSADYLPLLDGLSPILRSARNLHSVLTDARKAATDSRELIDARDEAYEVARTAELLYQDAKNALDISIVRRAEEQALASARTTVAAHRLNVMAAVFFPLATLSGIFGTTLTDGWSWSRSEDAFQVFLAVGLIAGLMLALFINGFDFWNRSQQSDDA